AQAVQAARATLARGPRGLPGRGRCTQVVMPSLPDDLVAGGLRGIREAVAERRQQRDQRLAGDELRDDAVRPDGLVGIRDHAPTLPDELGRRLERLCRTRGEVWILAEVRQPTRSGGPVGR